MTDYFKDISDWKDGDEQFMFKPKTYLEYEDVFEYNGHKFRFHYVERDWNVLGYTEEENLALGRCCVIILNKEDMPMKAENVHPCTVVSGTSHDDAMTNLRTILNMYLEMKDLTRTEFETWRKSRNSSDTA